MSDPISTALMAWVAKKFADSATAAVRHRRLRERDAPEVRRALTAVVRTGVDDALAQAFPDDLEQQQRVRALLLEREEDRWPLVDGTYPVDLPAAMREWVAWIESPPEEDGVAPVEEDHPFALQLSVALLERLRHEATRGERVLATVWLDFKSETGLDVSTTRQDGTRILEFWNPSLRGAEVVGRQSELEALAMALESGTGIGRVQSVGGLAGVGKTTLAVAYGDAAASKYPDGRIFYDFQSYTAGRAPRSAAEALVHLLPTIHPAITAATITDLGIEELVAAWRECTASRRLLMVWDNIRSTDQIAPLLVLQDGCATILTSRDTIPIEGAHMTLWLDALSETDAVALFNQVAGGDHPIAQVRELVQRDLFMPVLIQSHATAIATGRYALTEILADLPDAPRTPAPRTQEELFKRLDGSYRHLTEDQQFALRAFGSHPGAFATIGSLSAMLGCDLDEADLLMNALFDAGFVRRHRHKPENSDATLRAYTSHDLLRAYATHKAVLAGDRNLSQAAVADYFLRMIEEHGEDPSPWLDIERDNIRDTALAGDSAAHSELCLRLADRVKQTVPHRVEANLYRHAASLFETWGEQRRLIEALLKQGTAESLASSDQAVATRCFQRAADLAQSIKDQRLYGAALNGLGQTARSSEDYHKASMHHGAAATIAESLHDTHLHFVAISGLGLLAERRKRYAEANSRYQEALDIARSARNFEDEAQALTSLSLLADRTGDSSAAVSYSKRRLEILESNDLRKLLAWELSRLGGITRRSGDDEGALELYDRARRIFGELGDDRLEAMQIEEMAKTEAYRRNFTAAESHYHLAAQIHEQIGDLNSWAFVLHRLGSVKKDQNDFGGASVLIRRAVELREIVGNKGLLESSLRDLIYISEILGDHQLVIECQERLVAIVEEAKDPRKRADSKVGLGRALTLAGEQEAAAESYQSALQLYANTGSDGVEGLISLARMFRRTSEYAKASECFQALAKIHADLADG